MYLILYEVYELLNKIYMLMVNHNMFHNPIVQENIEKLKGLGYKFIEPKDSHLACGTTGKGALADVDDIIAFTEGVQTK